MRPRCRRRALHGFGVGHVHDEPVLGGSSGQAVRVAIPQAEPCAFRREPDGDAEADPGRAARHHRHLLPRTAPSCRTPCLFCVSRRDRGRSRNPPEGDKWRDLSARSIRARPAPASSSSTARAAIASAQKEHEQIYPQPGWVEHDPLEIWRNTPKVIAEALSAPIFFPVISPPSASPTSARRRCSGTARTGEPLHNALVWQDTRTDAIWSPSSRATAARTASAPRPACRWRATSAALKLRWLLDNVPGARAKAEAGDAAVRHDRLLADLESDRRPRRLHVTDVTNASRTLLMNLATLDWDDELLAAFGIPRAVLPRIVASSEVYGKARGAARGRAGRRHPGRSAGRAGRAGLLRSRARRRTPTARAVSC